MVYTFHTATSNLCTHARPHAHAHMRTHAHTHFND